MNTPSRPPLPAAMSFLAFLQQYRNDRGALAHLRGALSETRRQHAWPLLGGFPGAIGTSAFETAAALWAHAPELSATTGNLGETLTKLKSDHPSFEGRFKRLLTCDRDEIAARIAPIVRAAQAQGVRVNYTQLLSDLLCWGDGVKVSWAKAFWGNAEVAGDINPAMLDSEEPGTRADSAEPASFTDAKEA